MPPPNCPQLPPSPPNRPHAHSAARTDIAPGRAPCSVTNTSPPPRRRGGKGARITARDAARTAGESRRAGRDSRLLCGLGCPDCGVLARPSHSLLKGCYSQTLSRLCGPQNATVSGTECEVMQCCHHKMVCYQKGINVKQIFRNYAFVLAIFGFLAAVIVMIVRIARKPRHRLHRAGLSAGTKAQNPQHTEPDGAIKNQKEVSFGWRQRSHEPLPTKILR
ncbi:uncharacterized protein [Scyliorhinus torazame]|uniref:uncharacterized protein isoform X2 n=1 Tax=Scyliorhinus torazame TaxID=75743 RepID=UPI003B59BB1B